MGWLISERNRIFRQHEQNFKNYREITNLAYNIENEQLKKEKKKHERKINFHVKRLGNNKKDITFINNETFSLKPERKTKHSTYVKITQKNKFKKRRERKQIAKKDKIVNEINKIKESNLVRNF